MGFFQRADGRTHDFGLLREPADLAPRFLRQLLKAQEHLVTELLCLVGRDIAQDGDRRIDTVFRPLVAGCNDSGVHFLRPFGFSWMKRDIFVKSPRWAMTGLDGVLPVSHRVG